MGDKKLLACREYDGLGDWIMAMSVLKMVNLQYPNIDIHVKKDGKKNLNRVYDIVDNMDVELTRVQRAEPSEYDYYIKHMIYFEFTAEWHKQYSEGVPKDYVKNHLIHGMVKKFNEETKLNLKYDENVLARYKNIVPFGGQKPYVVIPSCGSKDRKEKDTKAWGTDNYKEQGKVMKGPKYFKPDLSKFIKK